MVHYVESLRLELEGKTEKSDSSNAQRTEQRAQQIIEKRDELRAKADSVIEIISNPQVAESLGQDKERNLATLKEKYNVSSWTALVAKAGCCSLTDPLSSFYAASSTSSRSTTCIPTASTPIL